MGSPPATSAAGPSAAPEPSAEDAPSADLRHAADTDGAVATLAAAIHAAREAGKLQLRVLFSLEAKSGVSNIRAAVEEALQFGKSQGRVASWEDGEGNDFLVTLKAA